MKAAITGQPFFDETRALRYDRIIRASLPGYEALHAMVRNFLSTLLPPSAHIVVVGAGTGMDLITLGKANPKWCFTATE